MIRDMWEQRDYEPGQAGSAGSANQWAARATALATEFLRRSAFWTPGCGAGARSWGLLSRCSPRSMTRWSAPAAPAS